MIAQHEIRGMTRDDWTQVRDIHAERLATGLAAFSLSPTRRENRDNNHFFFGRLIAGTHEGQIMGWTTLSAVPDT